MRDKNAELQRKETNEKVTEIFERSSIRWLMVVYDTILYLLCWLAILVLDSSSLEKLSWTRAGLYFIAGYMLFFGFRMALKCYRQIWRYCSLRAFSREFFAGVLGAALFVTLGYFLEKKFPVVEISLTSLISFAAVYVLVSIAVRIFYCHMYRFAEKKSKLYYKH